MGKIINFQDLTTQKENTLPEPGIYMMTIVDAKMRTGSTSGNEYLELKAELSKGDGKKITTFFDRIFDTESDIPRFKLRQFILALKLPITGEFRLSDLAKMVVGKKLLADIFHEKSKDPQYKDKLAVNPFNEVYYPIEKAAELLGLPAGGAPVNNPINAADAADANVDDGLDY